MKKVTLLIALFAITVGFAQPTNNAPNPTQNAADVISIYGGSFTNVATNYDPNWGQSGVGLVNPNFDPGTGNLVLAYPNFNYQGTELITQNASSMEYLHVDIWTANATNVKVSPINNGTGAGEFLVNIPLVTNGWSSVNLPKSAFVGMTWDSVFQLKFDGQAGTTPSTIYLDNIYFWKTPTTPGSDATLSDLKVNGTTISGFNASVINYNVELPNGTTTIPQITSATTTDAGATRVISQATALPGSATVVVTSQNTSVTKTYTVNFLLIGPPTAAPTPPARLASDVRSIFSNAYAPISTIGYTGDDNTYNNTWCGANTTLVQVAGNDTHKVTGLGCEGITFIDGRFNATSFTHFHMDIYTDTATLDKSFNVKFSNWNGGTGEANAIEYSVNNSNFLTNPNPGTWISLDIPLTNFTPINGANRNDIVQFVISSDLGTVYYDNLYLHKNTVLGTSNFEISNVRLYPNPVTNVLNIEAALNIEKVSVYNLLGQEVISQTPNSELVVLNVASLKVGIYVVKTTIDGKVSSKKFVKE